MRAGIMFFTSLLLLVGCVATKASEESGDYNVSVSVESNMQQPYSRGNFCGVSTYGSCNSDAQCQEGGCSSQVCQSINEESVFTTCEYRECYDARKYNLRCKCFSNRCQWAQ